jgi:hypothetical protein
MRVVLFAAVAAITLGACGSNVARDARATDAPAVVPSSSVPFPLQQMRPSMLEKLPRCGCSCTVVCATP